ncbi:MAG TPA: hypothetical protein VGP72_32770 [Planctomycetota bacterium]
MPNIMVLYDIPSFVEEKWEEGLKAGNWKRVSRGAYAKAFAQPEQAATEVTQIFQSLNVQLEEEDEEHVRIVIPIRDQQGNPNLGIKTLFGKKPG